MEGQLKIFIKFFIMKQGLFILCLLLLGINVHAYDFTVDGNSYDIVSISDFTCKLAKANTGIANFVVPAKVSYNGKEVSVVEIGSSAFLNNRDVVTVEIPSSILSIGYNAFKGCTVLKNVSIPSSVSSISTGAFQDCTSLEYLNIPNTCPSLPPLIISGCKSLKKFVIHNRIENLPSSRQYASNDYYDVLYGTLDYYTEKIDKVSLDSLIIEDSSNPLYAPSYYLKITYTGKGCGYFGYLQTRYVYIGRDMTYKNTNYGSSDVEPFYGNPYIEELVFGDLCSHTMNIYGKSLAKVTLGKGISTVEGTHIPNGVKELYLKTTVPPIVLTDFSNSLYVNATVYVPKGTLEAYKSSAGWKNFWNIQECDVAAGIVAPQDNKTTRVEVSRYNSQGAKLVKEEKGLNIIRYNDGSVRKTIVK